VQPVLLAPSSLFRARKGLQELRRGRWLSERLLDDRRVVLLQRAARVRATLLGVLLPAGVLPLLHDDRRVVHTGGPVPVLGGLVRETAGPSARLRPLALAVGLGLVAYALSQRVPLGSVDARLLGFLGLSAALGLLAAASP
jgi:hypothetical protein